MQKHIAILVVVCTATLVACGSKTDANEKNFKAALDQYYDKKGDLCSSLPSRLIVWDTKNSLWGFNDISRKMGDALEAAGLVEGEDIDSNVLYERDEKYRESEDFFKAISPSYGGTVRKGKQYNLTNAAKPFVRESTVPEHVSLCWGNMAVDKVVKWQTNGNTATVTYTYKVKKAADWAKMPEVHVVFPGIKPFLDDVSKKELRGSLTLTNLGWEVENPEL